MASEIAPLDSISEMTTPYAGKVLITVPYQNMFTEDLALLGNFISGGGILVLADDFGYGNTLLSYLGVPARFSNVALLDPVVCYKNRWLPLVVRFAPDPLTTGISELVLNHPTSLTGVSEAKALAWSSSLSFSDDNNSGQWNNGEAFGPLPVIARYSLGEGQLILISDPSVFINSNQVLGDNNQLLLNIAGLAENGLYFDQSYLPPSELVTAKDFLHNLKEWLAAPVGTMLLVAAMVAAALLFWWPSKKHNLLPKRSTHV